MCIVLVECWVANVFDMICVSERIILYGERKTQITYVLFRETFYKHVSDIKVIPGDGITKQHQLLVRDFPADTPPA